ncbi:MAG: U32 family peptidase, partial [Rhodospirillaceae bacterium]|nr:U32 family peptidase [Rhodospirillaceae bacterium]
MDGNAPAMNTTLVMGPVLFNWTPEEWRDFHFRIADEADVDEVCVGEVVCSKRAPFFAPYLGEVIERLRAADKRVLLSTLALIMNKREMDSVRDIASIDDDSIMVEANDVSATALLKGRPHAVGPYVNVYNEDTLA